jgi:serine/threonine protein kinase
MVIGEHPWNVSNTSIMLRQILKAAYTVPGFVSPACKNLIQSMMKVTPADRITIESLLEHPWMKLAESVPTKPSFKAPALVIPAPQPATIKDISEASARASQHSDSGICSPFEAGAAGSGAMPKLVQRSLSFENMVSRGPEENMSARRKVQGPGVSLAQSRQRSATNLEAQRRAQVGRRKVMGPIDEDDG